AGWQALNPPILMKENLEQFPGTHRPSGGQAASSEEFLVVQGVVDLAVVLPSEIWLLDFKTDQIGEADWPERLKAYGRQLKVYSLALQRIYKRPVTNCWLHFLALNR